jgi:hypothetical protein
VESRIGAGTLRKCSCFRPNSDCATVLNGEITRDALAPMVRRTELTLQLERAQREGEIARRRVEEVRRLVEVGQGTELDLKRTEVELLQRQLEIKSVQRELKILGRLKR